MSRAAQYGDDNAAIYDVLYPRIDREALACLRRLTGDGHALELGVGTGRYAAALAEAGTRVTGVDASIPMLQRCRMRSTRVQLIRGDLAALPFRSGFRLAYSLVSTLGLLPDRESQRRCLVGIAAALEPSGLYVDESTSSVQESAACLRPFECAVAIPAAEPAVYRLRYLPLPQTMLDSFAAAAGLALFARWQNWHGLPWSAGAAHTISVYRRGRCAAVPTEG